jgi:hypothetical protein
VAAKISSLLPYLDAENSTFYLRLLPASGDASALQKMSYPFLVLSDSNHFHRLIAAQLVTDTGSHIRDIFFLVQKDKYAFQRDSLWPISNREIDRYWQDTFTFYSNEHRNSSLIPLLNQLDESGKLIPFDPLFYCKLKQHYFQPPCPRCGAPLRQCCDDAVLSGVGLSPYATSLKRYLFCSPCLLATGDPKFYAYQFEGTDPSMVTDFDGLIRGWGSLVQAPISPSEFPCGRCSNREQCYGSEHLVSTRIAPFSFYAFHLLVFEAMSLHAPDFLALVGGSSFFELEEHLAKEREPGRINRLQSVNRNTLPGLPFLFGQGEKHFFEVLYLKLSFLAELAQIVLMEAAAFGRDIDHLAMDSVWIRLDADGRRLPSTWNFKVDIIDIVSTMSEDASPPPGPYARNRDFLGRVWFYTLLVNGRQRIAQVYSDLKKVMQQSDAWRDWSMKDLTDESMQPTFSPWNIFWNPEGSPLREPWPLLWERSLGLGFSLLREDFQSGRDWSKEAFLQELEDLRQEVKERLFQEEPIQESGQERGEFRSEVDAIVPMLERIREKWSALTPPEPVDTGPPAAVATPEIPVPPQFEGVAYAEDIITETIIISPSKPLPEALGLVAEKNGQQADVDVEATVYGGSPGEAGSADADELAETVILGAATLESGKAVLGGVAEEPEGVSPPPGEVSEEDFLAATVMIGAPKVQPEERVKPDAAPRDAEKPEKAGEVFNPDDLLETVLVVPGKPRPTDKKDAHD